jgi:glycine betaine/proline transport system ATP-binding protein
MLEDQDREFAYVVDPKQNFLGMVSADSLRAALKGHEGALGLQSAYLADVKTVSEIHPVNELFGQVAQSPWPLPVVNDQGRYIGAISKTTLLRFMDRGTD